MQREPFVRHRRSEKYTAMHAPQGASNLLMALDGYQNALASLGNSSPLLQANEYVRGGVTGNRELLTVLYRENWIVKRIIDTVSEDMTRSWYEMHTQMPPDRLTELRRLEARHNIKGEMTNALKWSRLYGGAVALMMIKGQEDMLDQPLDMDMLMPGCFRGVIVLDRWTGVQPGIELVEDMDDVDFGLPKYYELMMDTQGGRTLRVHHSRILRFTGRTLPPDEERLENYWGASELEHIYEELCKRNATSANIAQLIFQANLRIWKSGDFGDLMATASKEQQRHFFSGIEAQNRLMSSFGLQVMNATDSMESHPYTFSGISDVYETFMMDMAGAAEIPATKLFGRAPAGMNATGESDLVNYYESILQKQEEQLRPALERMLPVLCMSLWGQVPDDMEIEFNPVRSASPAERAQIGSQFASAIAAAYTAGIISQRTAMTELRETGKSVGMFTKITDEDIAQADDSLDGGEMGEMGGLLGEPGENPQAGEEAQEGPLEGEKHKPEEEGMDAAWKEEDHPRRKDGKFGEGGSGGSGSQSGAGSTAQNTGPVTAKGREIQKALSAKHPKVNKSKQSQHENAQAAREATERERREKPKAKTYPKSYFTVKMQAVHAMVLDRVRNGNFEEDKARHGDMRLIVRVAKPIGKVYNKATGKIENSNCVSVAYSGKDGYHIFPQIDE